MSNPPFRPLDELSKESKILYTKMLVTQILADGEIGDIELAELYTFMTTIKLDEISCTQILDYLLESPDFVSSDLPAVSIINLMTKFLTFLTSAQEKEHYKLELIHDLYSVSDWDGAITDQEIAIVKAVANKLYGEEGDAVFEFVATSIRNNRLLATGQITEDEFRRRARETARNAAKVGIPLAAAAGIPLLAVGLSGSVAGLSAAGMTSGLAALGMGGLGLSAMATGIGAVAVLGVGTFAAAKWGIDRVTRRTEDRPDSRVYLSNIYMLSSRISLLEYWQKNTEEIGNLRPMAGQNDKRLEKLERLNKTLRNASQILKERLQNLSGPEI